MGSCIDHPHLALLTCPHCEIATLRAWQRRAVKLLQLLLTIITDKKCRPANEARALIAEADDNPSSVDPPGVMDEGVGNA